MDVLRTVLPYLIGLALVSTLAVLVVGIIGMSRGSEFNRRHANTLMRLRVGMQAMCVALLALYFVIIAV
ncbi:MAG: twin transmembrane helix small protein [Proteobacteria bacterium]|nr:twin transmembrane helix small protein [Pseudomonadota bacterium]